MSSGSVQIVDQITKVSLFSSRHIGGLRRFTYMAGLHARLYNFARAFWRMSQLWDNAHTFKGHSQLAHLHIRYSFIANLHIKIML